jgi:hypothetical protein
VTLRITRERGRPVGRGPGRAMGVECADLEQETDREADGDDEREADRAEVGIRGV